MSVDPEQLPSPYIAETLDFTRIEVEPGRAVFQGTPQRKHYNPLGSVHGGWFSTSRCELRRSNM